MVQRVVVHRRYVPAGHAHYGGNLVDGAYVMGLFGEVATELAVVNDGDEGLLAGYDHVRFIVPVLGGDVVEVSGTVTRVGRRSRQVAFVAQVVCRAEPDRSPSASRRLDPPLRVAEARGTVVVPSAGGDGWGEG